MASTRFRMMVGVAMFVVALSALEAYRWDGGPEDKAKIRACVGGSASFPWSIVTGLGETMLGRDWRFQEQDGKKTHIATYQNKHFYAAERFAFLPNAGLSLRQARPQDSGNYSVQVQLQQANSSLASAGRTVTLSVTDRPPVTQDGALHVTMSDAVRDDDTKDWTLQLHCGHFVYLGHPPVDVFWTTPSGEVRNSSYQDNGTFVLSVSSPVQGGNYSCQLPPSAPAARCLTATSPLSAAAKLYVDDKDVMMSFVEARLRELEYVFKDISVSSCADWLKYNRESGLRKISMMGKLITVYCDQTTDNGGWLVFQRRKDASVDFFRGWADYRNGFGDLEGNFWLGLDKLRSLTTSQTFELRVDLQTFDGTKGYATYSGFYVDDVSLNFALHFDNFTGGNAGDSLSFSRGQQFSTKDRDHDTGAKHCAQLLHGAWWYKGCSFSNLNGNYTFPSVYQRIFWYHFGNVYVPLKFSEMKFRPM